MCRYNDCAKFIPKMKGLISSRQATEKSCDSKGSDPRKDLINGPFNIPISHPSLTRWRQYLLCPPGYLPTEAGWHRLCISNQIKNWRFIMFLSGYIFTFVIGVAVGFLFAANMIHSGLDQST